MKFQDLKLSTKNSLRTIFQNTGWMHPAKDLEAGSTNHYGAQLYPPVGIHAGRTHEKHMGRQACQADNKSTIAPVRGQGGPAD